MREFLKKNPGSQSIHFHPIGDGKIALVLLHSYSYSYSYSYSRDLQLKKMDLHLLKKKLKYLSARNDSGQFHCSALLIEQRKLQRKHALE